MRQHSLPDSYAAIALTATAVNVPAIALTATAVNLPALQTCLDEARTKGKRWVEHALALVEKEELT